MSDLLDPLVDMRINNSDSRGLFLGSIDCELEEILVLALLSEQTWTHEPQA